jgi:hypothetical protein
MINKSIKLLVLMSFLGCAVFAQKKEKTILSNTDLVKLDFTVLAQKKALLEKDQNLQPAYKELIKNAEALLGYKPVSVMEKTELPPSGTKHDYMSVGPYWWPDPTKSDGLPYIRKDGEVNPEVKSYPDKNNMPKLCENVYTLGLAYYFSGNEKYAAHAAKLMQVWFLDTATRMNPNVNFGQAIKGITTGRAEGIIDTRQFIFALDGIQLIKNSKAWTTANDKALKSWFTQYLNWLNTSKIGLDELNAKNNHGVWFDAQAIAIADYLADKKEVKNIIERATNRLDVQMNSAGLFPMELARTTSLHYSVFILNAFNIVAQIAEENGVDFYHLKTKSGKSFQKGFDAILPFISQKEKWTYQEIKPFHFSDAFALLLRCKSKMNCGECDEAIKKAEEQKNVELLLINLL